MKPRRTVTRWAVWHPGHGVLPWTIPLRAMTQRAYVRKLRQGGFGIYNKPEACCVVRVRIEALEKEAQP